MHKPQRARGLRIGAFWLALMALASCTSTAPRINPERMYESGSALTKLSAAMEAYIRFGNPGTELSEAQLLLNGTEHDPALLSQLGAYTVRVQQRERHAVLLLCSKETKQALLEDAGCTGKMDVHHWQQAPRDCSFTIEVASLCPATGNRRQ